MLKSSVIKVTRDQKVSVVTTTPCVGVFDMDFDAVSKETDSEALLKNLNCWAELYQDMSNIRDEEIPLLLTEYEEAVRARYDELNPVDENGNRGPD
jgi:hypothetical protein